MKPMGDPVTVGLLQRWRLSRQLKRLPPASRRTPGGGAPFGIRSILRVPDGGFFRRQALYWIFASPDNLTHTVLPTGSTSIGLFSWDRASLRYLCPQRPQELQSVFATELRALDDAEPTFLANLLCESLLVDWNCRHQVLASGDDLRSERFAEYGLDEVEWSRVAPSITPPNVRRRTGGGWVVDCWTLYGWMHDTHTLKRCTFRIEGDYRVRAESSVESAGIFASVPDIRY